MNKSLRETISKLPREQFMLLYRRSLHKMSIRMEECVQLELATGIPANDIGIWMESQGRPFRPRKQQDQRFQAELCRSRYLEPLENKRESVNSKVTQWLRHSNEAKEEFDGSIHSDEKTPTNHENWMDEIEEATETIDRSLQTWQQLDDNQHYLDRCWNPSFIDFQSVQSV